MTDSVKTSQLLQPQRLEGETYEAYVKRRRDMNKVVAQHLSSRGVYSDEYHITKKLPRGFMRGHWSTKPR